MRRNPEVERKKWGIPNWRDGSEYPKILHDTEWRWEFLRRCEDYRGDWKKCEAEIKRYDDLLSNGFQKVLEIEIIKLGKSIDSVFRKYGFVNSIPINPAIQDPEMLILESPDGPDIMDLARVEPMVQAGSLYRLSESYCAFFFDLEKAINPQIKKAQKMLLMAQRERSRNISDIRLHRENFPLYLRALDAEAEGATYREISKVLFPQSARQGNKAEEIVKAASGVQKLFIHPK
jgi:hypothetical protein